MQEEDLSFVCPVCKEGEVIEKDYICSKCNTAYKYKKKGQYFLLKKVGKKEYKPIFKDLVKRYPNGLKAHEWTNIAKGGLSDEENEIKEETEFLEKIASGDLSELPTSKEAPVLLKKDEVVYLILNGAGLYEDRTTYKYVGGTRGVSVRVAKGISFRVGGFKGERIPQIEQQHIDTGSLVVTNKRVIFAGQHKNLSFPITKLINVKNYIDGISINREGKQKTEYFMGSAPSFEGLKHYSVWDYVAAILQGIYKLNMK